MTFLVRSKYIVLDTAHLGALADDKMSSDIARQQKAQAFESVLEAYGGVLTFCHEHLMELFSCNGDDTSSRRVEYLQSLSLVAQLRTFDDHDTCGSLADLQSLEINAAYNAPEATILQTRDSVKNNIFKLVTGRDIVRPILENWSDIRRCFVAQAHRNREILAISKSSFAKNGHKKIIELINGDLRSPDDIVLQLNLQKDQLSEDIRLRGDKRNKNPDVSSSEFFDSVIFHLNNIQLTEKPGLNILQSFGLNPSDIDKEMTLDNVGELVVFRRRLKLINKNLNLPLSELIKKVPADRVVSNVIYTSIKKFHPNTREWDGSELNDRHFACLAAYADLTYVDKRTHEAARQAKQKSKMFASLAGLIEKASSYTEVCGQVTAHFKN